MEQDFTLVKGRLLQKVLETFYEGSHLLVADCLGIVVVQFKVYFGLPRKKLFLLSVKFTQSAGEQLSVEVVQFVKLEVSLPFLLDARKSFLYGPQFFLKRLESIHLPAIDAGDDAPEDMRLGEDLADSVLDVPLGVVLADAVGAAHGAPLAAEVAAGVVGAHDLAAVLRCILGDAGGHGRAALRAAEEAGQQELAVEALGRFERLLASEVLNFLPKPAWPLLLPLVFEKQVIGKFWASTWE